MAQLSKLDKLHAFLKFWFSPWGAAKGERWEGFSGDMPFDDHSAESICRRILAGEDQRLSWEEILPLKKRDVSLPVRTKPVEELAQLAYEQFSGPFSSPATWGQLTDPQKEAWRDVIRAHSRGA